MRRVLGVILVGSAAAGLWHCSRGSSRETAVVPATGAAEAAPRTEGATETAAPAEHVAAQPAADVVPAQRSPLEAGPPAPAPFAGRLVDVETGESVPWYEVRLGLVGLTPESVTSDAEGAFRTSAPLPPGKLRLRLVDLEGHSPASGHDTIDIEHDGTAQARSVPIEVGATYSVDVALPAPLRHSDVRARLFRDPPEFDDYGQESAPATILRAPCDTAALAWIRFRSHEQRDTPLWLELSSADGLWKGGARVAGGPGVHREPVHVELRPCCAVRGRYVTASKPGEGGLALFRSADGAPRWGHTASEGRFRFDGLAPGNYRLEVRADAMRAEPVAFTLSAGELDLGELPCAPIPLAGSVKLRVRSRVRLPIDVELVRRDDTPRYAPWHSDSWEPLPEGGFESRFEWDEIYAGTYDVVIHSHELGELHLTLGQLDPPVDDLVLELPPPPPRLSVEVVDARSGRALPEWTVLVRGERAWDETEAPGELALTSWNEDTAFAVSSPGYRAAVMNAGSPSWPARDSERLVVRLEPGWSHLFLARRRSRGDALAGVEVRLDGAVAGRTDAHGELWVHADAAAQRVEVAHPTLVWANADEAELDELVSWIVLRP